MSFPFFEPIIIPFEFPTLYQKTMKICVIPIEKKWRHCPPWAAEEAAYSNPEVEVEEEVSRLQHPAAMVMQFLWERCTGLVFRFLQA